MVWVTLDKWLAGFNLSALSRALSQSRRELHPIYNLKQALRPVKLLNLCDFVYTFVIQTTSENKPCFPKKNKAAGFNGFRDGWCGYRSVGNTFSVPNAR
jgi:hypothetical protein